MRKSFDKHWYAWAMVLPTVIVLGVLVFYPLLQGVWQSFTEPQRVQPAHEICTKILGGAAPASPTPTRRSSSASTTTSTSSPAQQGHFWLQFSNTLVWTLACVAFHYGLGLGLAVMLNRNFRGRGFYRVALILPWAVPSFVAAFAWRFIFDEQLRRHQRRAPGASASTPCRGSSSAGPRCSPPSSPTSGSACRS